MGGSLGQGLRNAAAATQNQVSLLRQAAADWAHRAQYPNYGANDFAFDFQNVQRQFQALRLEFGQLAGIVPMLGRAGANNVAAELGAGLDIIAELCGFLANRNAAGTLDQATVSRTASVLQEAVGAWGQELQKANSRLGLVW